MYPSILFVNPGNRLSQFGGVSEYATVAQPLGIIMLASVVRDAGYKVEVLDAEALNLSVEETVEHILAIDPLIVGVTAFTTKMTATTKILTLLREKNPYIHTIIGGHHPSALPERTLQETGANILIKGEGYGKILDAVKDILDGKVKLYDHIIYSSDELFDIDKLPLPSWDLLPMDKYQAHHWQTWGIGQKNSFALVFTSLGCPFGCRFCSVNVVYGKRGTRYMSSDRVINYLDKLKKLDIKHLEIIDDTFTLKTDRVIELCDKIIERDYGFNMWAFARTDRTDPKMLKKMKEAGINWVFMGLEAGSEKVLDGVFKKQDVKQIKEAVQKVHDAGIYIGGNYIFGLPNDTMESMQETLDLALDLNLEWSNFFVAMTYPGCIDYKERAIEHWERYGFFAPNSEPTPNANLTGEQILRFRDYAFNTYFSNPAYQEMIAQKFGYPIKEHIQGMLKRKINRVYETIKPS